MKGEDVPSPSLILISRPSPSLYLLPHHVFFPFFSSNKVCWAAAVCTLGGCGWEAKTEEVTRGDAADLLPWRGSQSLEMTNQP